MKFYLEKLLFLYLIFSGVLSYLLPNELLKSILALPAFIIFPYLAGFILTNLVSSFREHFQMFDVLSRLILRFMVGMLLIWIFIMFFQFLDFYFIVKYFVYLLLVCYMLFLLAEPKILSKYNDETEYIFNLIKKHIYIIILIAIFSITSALLAKIKLPFPLVGWYWLHPVDLYQPVERAIEHGFLLNRRTIQLVLYFIPAKFYNVSPMALNWIGAILNTLIYGFGLYLFSYKLFQKRSISLLTVFFGLYILTYNGQPFNNYFTATPSYDFASGVILYAFFPHILYLFSSIFINSNIKKLKLNINKFRFIGIILVNFNFVALIFILGMAYHWAGLSMYNQEKIIVGLSALTLMISYFSIYVKNKLIKELLFVLYLVIPFYLAFHQEAFGHYMMVIFIFILFTYLLVIGENNIRYLVYLFVIFTFLYVSLQVVGLVNIPTTNPLSSLVLKKDYATIIRTFMDRYDSLRYALPTPVLELFLIGAFLMLIKNEKNIGLLVVFISSFILFLYFSPESWLFRLNRELAPFMAVIIAYSFYMIYKLMSRMSNRIYLNKLIASTIVILLLIITIPSLMQPSVDRYTYPMDTFTGLHTPIALYEFKAANWLKSNTSDETVIISDPFTMLVLNGLANKIHIVQPAMSIRPLNEIERSKLETIKQIFKTDNSTQILELLSVLNNITYERDKLYLQKIYKSTNINNYTYLLVISSRTVTWAEGKSLNPVMKPQYGKLNTEYIRRYTKVGEIVYYDPNIVIIKVNRT